MTLSLRSLYVLVAGPNTALDLLAASFDVPEGQIYETNTEYPLDYLDTQTHVLLYQEISGDFRWSVELQLLRVSETQIAQLLWALTQETLALACPDESTPAPDRYVLFLDGDRIPCVIVEDEVFEETYIHDAPELRRRVRAKSL